MPHLPEGWTGAGASWSILTDGARTGAWNMGADSALLQSRADGAGGPILRLYWWSRPTLSLGRFQDVAEVDLQACREAGVDVVRRPTGGRAVLHDDEVTYSVVASTRHGLPRGVAVSYGVLCAALVGAYERLGVAATLTRGSRGRRSSACYLQATRADLSLGAAKLSGSAQVWRGDTCLQHGSLVVSRDAALEARLLRLVPDEARRLYDEVATIEAALRGERPSRDEISAAVREGFAETLGVSLHAASLTPAEERAANQLALSSEVLGVKGQNPKRGADVEGSAR